MSNAVALPERFTIENVEALHAEVRTREPGVLTGGEVKNVDGAALQWLAVALGSGWTLEGCSEALTRGVALLGLQHAITTKG